MKNTWQGNNWVKKKKGPKFKQNTTPQSAELTMGFCVSRQATVAQNAILQSLFFSRVDSSCHQTI
jgi:hypothetical protein